MDADSNMSPIARNLLKALMQFRRAEWHQRSIAGYKPSEIKVLLCIKRGIGPSTPEIKVSEISKRLHVTSPTVTQLIKGLEADGLIERHIDPQDRRSAGIKLTEKGEFVTRQAETAFEESVNGLIEYLGEEQSNQLVELLMKAYRYYEEKAAGEQHLNWHGDEEA
jgi:DNA-binding MarR family transcriptional regulator